MKTALLTKNRRARRVAPRLSLFPLLAVLICAMGALVLLLLVVTRQARHEAVHLARIKAKQEQGDRTADREVVQWRVEQLKKSREETQSQLTEARQQLGHLEDHARRLQEQLAKLEAAGKDLADAGAEVAQRRGGTEAQLRKLQEQIADAEGRVSDARKAVGQRPRSYAIIPYQGPNETHRRPIYVECRADALVLQPEGITFTESDFEGPMGPGNPLAAGLRAAREHILAQGGFDPQRDGEPYPLLLVRPSGTIAYYAARLGMKSWASEFGYELIGEDWPLQFPPPDPRLAQVVGQAVAAARARQQELIAAAPRSYRARSKPSYRLSPSGGGFVREDGSADDGPSGFRGGQTAGRYGNRYGSAGGGWGDGTGSGEPGSGGSAPVAKPVLPYGNVSGAGGEDGSAPGNSATAAGTSDSRSGSGGPAASRYGVTGGTPGGAAGGTTGSPYGAIGGTPGVSSGGPPTSPYAAIGGPGDGRGGTPGISAPSGVAQGASAGMSSAEGAPSGRAAVSRPEGYVAGRPGEPTPVRQEPTAATQVGMALRPGEWHPSEEFAPPPKRDEDPDDKRRHKKDMKSLADKRGQDWGLRNAAHGSVAITRPIRVACYPDRLVILSEDGRSPVKIVPLDVGTEKSVDKFISAVWEHMDSWGIAGRGMYWRPVLQVSTMPGGEQRFEELNSLLEGSGLTVQRR